MREDTYNLMEFFFNRFVYLIVYLTLFNIFYRLLILKDNSFYEKFRFVYQSVS